MPRAIPYQLKTWTGKFGREYTDRNAVSLDGLDKLYRKNFGITRTDLNNLFIGRLSRDFRILEVGSNVGNQLALLQKMGFKNLYSIEINSYAVEQSKLRTEHINIIQGSALDIPFKDDYFDLVYTSGVLIHIFPDDIRKALEEIHRCSRRYIWGYEYYADKYTKGKNYRGHDNLFWKADFSKIYLSTFNDLKLVEEKKLKYLNDDNVDAMFLLEKKR